MSLSLYKKLADMAITSLDLQPGQFVEIRGDVAMWECIEAVSLAVERAGAVPCLNVTSIAHEAERIRSLPADWLRCPSPFLLDLANRAAATIVIERDWRPLSESCPPGRLTAWNQAIGVLVNQQDVRHVRNCMIAHPGAVRQDELLVPREEIYKTIESAICKRIVSAYEASNSVTLRTWSRLELLKASIRAAATIVIERDWRPLSESCPPGRLTAWNQAIGVLVNQQDVRHVRNCMIAHPGAVRQDELLVPREEIYKTIESAITWRRDVRRRRAGGHSTMGELDERIRSVKQFIENGSVLDIRTRNGSRLECELGIADASPDGGRHASESPKSRLDAPFYGFGPQWGRPVFESDARLHGSPVLNLPFGSISFTVPETTVQGSICFRRWRNVQDLTFTFVDGCISEISAANSPRVFADFVGTHSGHRDRISHIGIGVNPGIQSPTGLISVDECKSGMLFVALGENRYLGGKNESTLNMDLTCPDSTVFIGSQCIVRDGRLTLDCQVPS